ncbi:hypothetical protein CGCA056_v012579 [Colletotrichum aenigma]|uniref:uncharacterized protein n=1 Tax=Colletotrichum aenigma TaxID=1215731 RepID=UPI001872E595|nr:uncharacterized protein CGCA056_v012579 [Colletotrichum aenigma]KAF5513028.1 hypothetical protein CGCA056_v012579 [Colletotrichum aenigma]
MSLEDSVSSDPLAPYAVGTTLKLLPHSDPTPPYGGPKYGWLGDEEEDKLAKSRINHPSNYTLPEQQMKGEKLRLKVLELTRDPAKDAPQGALLLVCQVTKIPTAKLFIGELLRKDDLVVAEVFDELLYDTLVLPFAPVLSPTQQADSGLSRTAGIYKHFYSENLTGSSQIVPQYHGTWVVQHHLKDTKSTSTRYVGAILREYVQGPSIESVCVRHECDGLFPLRKIRPHVDWDREIALDRETRLDIMKQIIHSCVLHKKFHVEHEGPEARNYVITLRRNGKILDKPQAVQVNFTRTYLWNLTIWAASSLENHKRHGLIPTLPHPLHPIEVYDISSLSDFAGWFPWHWAHGAHKRKGMSLMHRWFLQDDVFGPRQEGPRYSLRKTLGEQTQGEQTQMPRIASRLRLLSTGSQRSVGSEYSGTTGRSGRSRRGEGSGDTQEDDIPEDDIEDY